jgi:ribosomal protein S18 acetylase RimI-like enzyme
MRLTTRPYQDETDYWRVREFLRLVGQLNDQHEYSWALLRWDYWRWHVHENIRHYHLPDVVHLWELDGRIAAVLCPDSPGEAYFQVHPALRHEAPLTEMLTRAEDCLAVTRDDGRRELTAWVNEHDQSTKRLFEERGYARSKYAAEHMRRRPLDEPVPDSAPRVGYTVRGLREDELPARSWLSWKAFHPDEPDEKYGGWEWYRNVQRVPLYRRDLDIVAVSPEGELAAFCTVWFDDLSRTADFEPVGTHPDHQRRGLGKAVMTEGLRRARRLGAVLARVSSYGKGAHALYESMGFTEYDLLEPWIRDWAG